MDSNHEILFYKAYMIDINLIQPTKINSGGTLSYILFKNILRFRGFYVFGKIFLNCDSNENYESIVTFFEDAPSFNIIYYFPMKSRKYLKTSLRMQFLFSMSIFGFRLPSGQT